MKRFAANGNGEDSALRQVLTFRLGEEAFGLDLLRVKEIRGWSPVTRVPQSPPQVLGVLNLRGTIVPIIDLRLHFQLASAAFTPATVIIVMSIQSADGVRECGLVVDAVSDVIDIEARALLPAPRLSGSSSSQYIENLVATDDRMLILLNADQLLRLDLDTLATPHQTAA